MSEASEPWLLMDDLRTIETDTAALDYWRDMAEPRSWLDRLKRRFAQPLPGRAAQARFEPELSFGRHFGPPPPDARAAAVIVLIYPHQGEWHTPLTVRPATMQTHAGQISLPGGGVQAEESTAAAVLRELNEELGVPAEQVELLGQLSPLYLFNSNYVVIPWLGAAVARPDFVPDPREVAELLEVPLSHLVDRRHQAVQARRARGIGVRVPYLGWGRHQIWGATSMILAELLALGRLAPLDESR